MNIAIPLTSGKLSPHFGHCEQFALFTVEDGEVVNKEQLVPPAHEPGAFPRWLREKGADIIIAGGMGMRAQNLFTEAGVEVVCGASAEEPEKLVDEYINGKLVPGENLCDH
jgi:predicted Fe-Mo cluster-binding NifX family protein